MTSVVLYQMLSTRNFINERPPNLIIIIIIIMIIIMIMIIIIIIIII
jgi:hypothetical protein